MTRYVIEGARVFDGEQLIGVPTEALRAATSVPATMFGLDDPGRIAPGAR